LGVLKKKDGQYNIIRKEVKKKVVVERVWK